MTSRERIMKACNFQETDRVPIDIGGSQVTGICVDMYCNLLKNLGISETPTVYEQFEMLARISEPVRQRLHGDVISLENPIMSWGLRNENQKKWQTFKGNECYMPGSFNPISDEKGDLWLYSPEGKALAHMAKGSPYFDFADSTQMSETIEFKDPKEWREQIYLYTDEDLRKIESDAKFLHENTDYAVIGEFAVIRFGSMNRFISGLSPTDWLCALITDPDYISEVIEVCCERSLENAKLYLEAVGKNVDIILMSTTDFGSQRAEVFSPDIWRDLYMSRYRRINDFIHENTDDVKTFIHTCGSICNLIPHIIDAGFDILNPIQTSADGMDAEWLKKEFGGKITFWGGGVDTQHVLPKGTPEEVRAQVKERIDVFAKGGGYVFNPIHCIQHDVPAENLLAAADAAFEHRR